VELLPAIDLRAGRAVRLWQGDFGRETVYGTDPVATAQRFAAAGARWLHVVDLDAARTGEPENRDVVAAIAGAVHPSLAVQAGGGVRDRAGAEALFEAGVARVVVGTAAVENPELLSELAAVHPVAVALDQRQGEIALRGWVTGSSRPIAEVVAEAEAAGVVALVVTDVGRDGTLTGPDLEGLAAMLEATTVDVIASGGVSSLADIEALTSLDAGGRRLAGVIVGRALYEGRFTVEEAMAACAACA